MRHFVVGVALRVAARHRRLSSEVDATHVGHRRPRPHPWLPLHVVRVGTRTSHHQLRAHDR